MGASFEPPAEILVLKLGGSVLSDERSYRRAADWLRARLCESPRRRIVVVVSARSGHTDELLAEARAVSDSPAATVLDLFWSTGELRSVALLTLHLHALGVSAAGLNVHQTGVRVSDSQDDEFENAIDVNPLPVRLALATASIVVVPGFLARGSHDTVVTLGRGGSDLTAVLLADALAASTCELIKDVPGYFDRDPNRHADAKPLRALSFDRALALAADGCDLVQSAALRGAQAAGLRLIVRAFDGTCGSVVADEPAAAASLIESNFVLETTP